jgi:hypothetical protein
MSFARPAGPRACGVSPLALPFSVLAGTAAQTPLDACARDASHEERIAGCTSVLKARKVPTRALTAAYCNRAFALTELKQYDRVIVDSNAATRANRSEPCGYLNRGRGSFYKGKYRRCDRRP